MINPEDGAARLRGLNPRPELSTILDASAAHRTADAQDAAATVGLGRPDLEGAELTRRTAGSAVWLITARLLIKAIDFAVLLILARLLAVADFGLVAIAMTSVSIVEAVLEIPIYHILVGLDGLEDHHFDTAFTLSALRGLVMSVVLAALALPLAHFYGDVRLAGLIGILSLAPAMRGLGSPRLVVYARKLDFRRELAGELIGKIASLILASAAAVIFRDYRALMVGILATPATWIVASYILAPYRPRLSLKAWPLFAHFMSWTTASQFLSALNWQCDRLILGRYVNHTELGAFSLANDLSYVPEQALIKPILRPLISAFALIREDRQRLASAYMKSANSVLAIGMPVLLGLSLLAEPAVRFALGGKWVAAVPILQWLTLTLIPPLFTSPFSSLAMSDGHPQAMLWQTATEAMTKLPTMIVGVAWFGIDGAIGARGIASLLTALLVLLFTKRLIGVPVLHQLAAAWRTAAGALILAGTILVLRPLLDSQSGFMLGVALVAVATTSLLLYAATLACLWQLSGRPAGLEQTLSDRLVSPLLARLAVRCR